MSQKIRWNIVPVEYSVDSSGVQIFPEGVEEEDISKGELLSNRDEGILYLKKNDGTIVNISGSQIPTNHASTSDKYGKGTTNNYGHVKLSDSTSSTSGASNGGIAATPAAVKALNDIKADKYTNTNGFKAGNEASVYGGGGSIGYYATTDDGGAIGQNAYSTGGAAVGNNATTSNGVAIGYSAETIDPDTYNGIDAIQLGTGRNTTPKTMQVYSYQMMNASGKIPSDRLSSHASTTTTYGKGTSSNYGHVKLSDSTNSTNGVNNGTAATPNAVKSVQDELNLFSNFYGYGCPVNAVTGTRKMYHFPLLTNMPSYSTSTFSISSTTKLILDGNCYSLSEYSKSISSITDDCMGLIYFNIASVNSIKIELLTLTGLSSDFNECKEMLYNKFINLLKQEGYGTIWLPYSLITKKGSTMQYTLTLDFYNIDLTNIKCTTGKVGNYFKNYADFIFLDTVDNTEAEYNFKAFNTFFKLCCERPLLDTDNDFSISYSSSNGFTISATDYKDIKFIFYGDISFYSSSAISFNTDNNYEGYFHKVEIEGVSILSNGDTNSVERSPIIKILSGSSKITFNLFKISNIKIIVEDNSLSLVIKDNGVIENVVIESNYTGNTYALVTLRQYALMNNCRVLFNINQCVTTANIYIYGYSKITNCYFKNTYISLLGSHCKIIGNSFGGTTYRIDLSSSILSSIIIGNERIRVFNSSSNTNIIENNING